MASAVVVDSPVTLAVTTSNEGLSPDGSPSIAKPFNVEDPSYQVDPKFSPDKEDTWGHSMEEDGWIHAHNSLRREMTMMVKALRAVHSRGDDLKDWEVECIRTFWQTHFAHVHAHYHNEDVIMVPFLRTRFHYPEKAVTDHQGLEELLTKISAAVKALKGGQRVDSLLELMVEYEKYMLPHLREEEEICLPLMRAYFAPKEVTPKVQEIIGHGPKVEIGSLIACMGVEKWRQGFMPQEGIPGFVWYIDFKGRLKLFQKLFEAPVNAVTTGVQPEASRGCWK